MVREKPAPVAKRCICALFYQQLNDILVVQDLLIIGLIRNFQPVGEELAARRILVPDGNPLDLAGVHLGDPAEETTGMSVPGPDESETHLWTFWHRLSGCR